MGSLVIFKQKKLVAFYSPFAPFVFHIIPALIKEVIFRGTLLHYFIKRDKMLIGFIISILFFTLIHLLNLLTGAEMGVSTLVELTLAGTFLSLVYLNYGIVGSISVHYIWNVFNSEANFERIYSINIALIISCVIMYYLHQKKRNL